MIARLISIISLTAGAIIVRGDGEGPQARILNGTEFTWDEYPFVVRFASILPNEMRNPCTGSMIGVDWILSVAHCYRGRGSEVDSVNWKRLPVSKMSIRTHQYYEYGKRFADLVVAKVSNTVAREVPLSLPLPNEDLEFIDKERDLTLYGLGALERAPSTNRSHWKPPMGLRLIKERITLRCYFRSKEYGKLLSTVAFCSKRYPRVLQSACGGDSGGPLVAHSHDRKVIIGMLHSGWPKCVQAGATAFKVGILNYIRVTTYMPWILHSIDRSSVLHKMRDLMDIWMVGPYLVWPDI